MMTAQFLLHFLNTLKKWLSRHCPSSLSLFWSLLRQFASGHLKLGVCGRRLFAGTRFSSEALPQSQGNIARGDAPICSSFLPPPSSDDPYLRIHSQHSQHLRKGTARPQTNTTTQNGSSAEIDGGSTSSFHQSLQTGEGSSNISQTFPDGDPLEGSSSPGPSHLSSFHGPFKLSGSHSRSQTYTNDSRSLVAATPTPSTSRLALGLAHSKHSLVSQGSGQSLTRSITGSQCGQPTLRLHEGPVYHLPKHIHSSIALQDGPLDLVTGHHGRLVVPPGSDEMPGSEILEVYEDKPPGIFSMVAEGVMRYDRCTPR
ncbi:hypothetical protein BDR03DRAFT_102849 [Suillus americanus]|nr:hypothetical protein BDR03DRAFT_102849 [Suillus americanus]